MKLWLPDGLSVRVEWYLSDNKAVGVESITDDWIPRDLGTQRRAGFTEFCHPYDPERDDFVARDRKA